MEENFITVIGPDAHMKGEMVVEADTRILGRFEGNIVARGKLHIAEGATCEAHIEASELIIDGVIEGNIATASRIQINRTAVVYGDISSPTLMVEEGASIHGQVMVGNVKSEDDVEEEITTYEAPAPADMAMSTGPSAALLEE